MHDVVVIQRLEIILRQVGVIIMLKGRETVLLLIDQLRHRILMDFPSGTSRAASLSARAV